VFEESDRPQVSQAPPPPQRAGAPIDPARLVLALQRGRRALLLGALLSGALGVVVAKAVVSREFEARCTLRWTTSGSANEQRALKTLVDEVKLPVNLEQVRARLALTSTLDAVAKSVVVTTASDSNVFSVSAKASDSEAAARLADAVVEVFLTRRADTERERLVDRATVLEGDVEAARRAMLDARRSYDAFRTEHGIADLPAETQAAIDQAAQLRAKADIARAESQAELARADALQRAARAEPQTAVLGQTEIQPDARKLAEARAELAALSPQLSADHPRIRSLVAEVTSLEEGLTRPRKALSGERTIGRNPQWDAAQQGLMIAKAQRDAALRRQSAFDDLAETATTTVARLSKVEGEASTRLAQLRVAEKHLADLEDLLALARDAARSPKSGFLVLAPAKAPLAPSKSLRKVVAIVSPLLGLLIAGGLLIARALRGLRVHTASELTFWTAAPVVASSTWPREAGALGDLVEDLRLLIGDASGTTLFVGLTKDAPLAFTLAQAMSPPEKRSRAERRRPDAAQTAKPPRFSAISAETVTPTVRRAVRQATRVLVLVEAGEHSAPTLAKLRTRVGRQEQMGFVLVGLAPDLAGLPDRAGDLRAMWGRGDAPTSAMGEAAG
jgi:uncharacterized protein involved in exopolysaccharide biosynthesis